MLPLGFRLDVEALILDGTVQMAGYPLLPAVLPQYATRLAAGETHWAQCRPRECGCAPPSENASQLQGRASREGSGSVAAATPRRVVTPPASLELGEEQVGWGGAA